MARTRPDESQPRSRAVRSTTSRADGAESQSSTRWMASQVTLAACRSCRPRTIRAWKSPRRLSSSSRRLVTTTRNARHPEIPGTSARNSLRNATPSSTAPQRKPEKQ